MCSQLGSFWLPPDNVQVKGGLEYLYDTLSGSVFGTEAPTDVFSVAARVLVYIAHGHVFHDGNKRTGLHAAWELLAANGVKLRLDASAEGFVVDVADGRIGQSEVVDWLRARSG
jgi:death-on-curing family protein